MNPSLRVLLIGRHFWPHGSIDAAGSLIQLASGLHHRGVHVEVLTPRYASSWPESCCFREISVHRPLGAPKSDWTIGRYTRHLASWIRENAASFDVLLVDSAREEAIAAIEAARTLNSRSVIRIAGTDAGSDLNWWETSRAARRCAAFAKTADRVIVSSAEDQRELLSRGFKASKIHRVDRGFDGTISRTSNDRVQARRALAAINGDLQAPADEPVAICVTSMQRGSGVKVLVESARHLIQRYPRLHLWLIGDGPQRDSIFRTLRSDGVRASIAMPGSFGDMSDVFAAADLYAHTDDSAMEHSLPTAIAWELPIVVCDNESTRSLLQASRTSAADSAADFGELIHWYQAATPKTFRKAFRSVLDDLLVSQEKARVLRRGLLRIRSSGNLFDDYVALFERIRRESITTPHDQSMGAIS